MIALLLTTHDEAELLDWNLAHHLESGIDFIGVADNESRDHTADVVAAYGSAVERIVFADFHDRQKVRMQLLERAGARLGRFDWVGVSDTDEFWYFDGSSLAAELATVPNDLVAMNFDMKLFLPTVRDSGEPIMAARRYRSSGPESPLHTSYSEGKTFYRGSWLTEIRHEHWDRTISHERVRHDQAAVYHYMVGDEDQFVHKVSRLIAWAPNERRWLRRDPRKRKLPGWSAPFKKEWWGVYCEGGEAAVREYYRTRYTLGEAAIAEHLAAGTLVFDESFATYAERFAAARRPSA
jgi:hypothetical protein